MLFACICNALYRARFSVDGMPRCKSSMSSNRKPNLSGNNRESRGHECVCLPASHPKVALASGVHTTGKQVEWFRHASMHVHPRGELSVQSRAADDMSQAKPKTHNQWLHVTFFCQTQYYKKPSCYTSNMAPSTHVPPMPTQIFQVNGRGCLKLWMTQITVLATATITDMSMLKPGRHSTHTHNDTETVSEVLNSLCVLQTMAGAVAFTIVEQDKVHVQNVGKEGTKQNRRNGQLLGH